MKITDTISVNPSKKTLGHVDAPSASIFRSPVIASETENHSIDFLKILFPTSASATSEYRKYAVPLRTLFATILIVTGITMLEAAATTGLAICTLCFGGILALGLFTRPVMLGASVYFCIIGALALRAGIADMSVFALMFGCIIFALMGAGKYSCDQVLRKALLRQRKISERKRKDNLMGYKAFHSVKF